MSFVLLETLLYNTTEDVLQVPCALVSAFESWSLSPGALNPGTLNPWSIVIKQS